MSKNLTTLYNLPIKTLEPNKLLEEMRASNENDVFVLNNETIAVIHKLDLTSDCPHLKSVAIVKEIKTGNLNAPITHKAIRICTKCDKEIPE